MMKFKTAELIGISLDWFVTQCVGVNTYGPKDFKEQRRGRENHWSTDWSQGGSIIEQEKIATSWTGDKYGWCAKWPKWVAVDGGETIPTEGGHTALVAAMRCYVAGSLGDEVDVPDELL